MSATWRRPQGDDGQVLLLIVGFAVIVMLLITVVVNVSRVFLVQRGLGAAADGAAASAAGALDEDAVYTGGLDSGVPLDPVEARQRVDTYVAAGDFVARFSGFSVQSVAVTGGSVTVSFGSTVRLPFQALLPGELADGVEVVVAASARTPVQPP